MVLTSNATRELSEALKRRCLYLRLDYPDAEREREIVLARVPELRRALAEQLVRRCGRCGRMELKKSPSIAETHRLGADAARARAGHPRRRRRCARRSGVVLKHASDQERAAAELRLN